MLQSFLIICNQCLCRYRLYPEVHFPVPYLDCLSAAKHFLSPEVLARYAIDPERVAVSGDSAGGNLAAAVTQEVHAEPISCRNVCKKCTLDANQVLKSLCLSYFCPDFNG